MGLSILQGLTKSLAMTVISEIGDKTFFAAAILAMRHPRRLVLSGCLGALIIMTILSVLVGWAAPNLISRKWTHHITTLLFMGFGLWSLWDAYNEGEAEELAEVEAKLGGDVKSNGGSSKENNKVCLTVFIFGPVCWFYINATQPFAKRPVLKENGSYLFLDKSGYDNVKEFISSCTSTLSITFLLLQDILDAYSKFKVDDNLKKQNRPFLAQFFSPILLKAFSITFFGEWGDKSQLATIGLAADENPWGVVLGGIIGQAFCTTAAVLGGKSLATSISERIVSCRSWIYLCLSFALP
ncbi:GDT1 4 [Olea europaea subsp. europaea]|uniref:GDT1 family protein n=1 Tax=Olea europaea subsp. europaea TaxID=158383 RepID=A0A8S0RDJ3_OLEEU|nr:GDT1 4 [Olea europaea subsp. europaea]